MVTAVNSSRYSRDVDDGPRHARRQGLPPDRVQLLRAALVDINENR